MLKKRLVAVLILRDAQVVQSVQFKHTNIIHWKPETAVDFFDRWAVDEMVILDVSRTTQRRERFYEVVHALSEKSFVPLTMGGWIDSPEEVRKLLRLGADKVVINTEAVRRPQLITECATAFGTQCIVISIDAKRLDDGGYEVYVDRGREPTGLDAVEWARTAQERGGGEVFLNCIDADGFRQGYELPLIRAVSDAVDIPVVAMGGVMTWDQLVDGVKQGKADAVAAANIFHYTEHSTKKAKEYMRAEGLDVR